MEVGMRVTIALFATTAAEACVPAGMAGNEPQRIDSAVASHNPASAVAPFTFPGIKSSAFGTVSTDPEGNLFIEPATRIANSEGQQIAWMLWVGDTSDEVEWTEAVVAPSAGAWPRETVTESRSLSSDGRTLTSRFSTVPVDGFAYNNWKISRNQPPGEWKVIVTIEGQQPRDFSFTLSNPLGQCPFWRTHFIWWWASLVAEEGDPKGLDLSKRVQEQFALRLLQHEFEMADTIDDAYWIVEAYSSRLRVDQDVAHGTIQMRALADFQGRALRYDFLSFSNEGTLDYQHLFEVPVERVDEYVWRAADSFAAALAPHARRKCVDWRTGQLDEEARLEQVRAELVQEIERVRRDRSEREQRKQLLLEIEALPTP